MEWSHYIVLLFSLTGFFFGVGLVALAWAVRAGQMRDFDQAATSIFDDEEPMGKQSDLFPTARNVDQRREGWAASRPGRACRRSADRPAP